MLLVQTHTLSNVKFSHALEDCFNRAPKWVVKQTLLHIYIIVTPYTKSIHNYIKITLGIKAAVGLNCSDYLAALNTRPLTEIWGTCNLKRRTGVHFPDGVERGGGHIPRGTIWGTCNPARRKGVQFWDGVERGEGEGHILRGTVEHVTLIWGETNKLPQNFATKGYYVQFVPALRTFVCFATTAHFLMTLKNNELRCLTENHLKTIQFQSVDTILHILSVLNYPYLYVNEL